MSDRVVRFVLKKVLPKKVANESCLMFFQKMLFFHNMLVLNDLTVRLKVMISLDDLGLTLKAFVRL